MNETQFFRHQYWHNVNSEIMQFSSILLQLKSIQVQNAQLQQMQENEKARMQEKYMDILTQEFISRGDSPLEAFKKAKSECLIEEISTKTSALINTIAEQYANIEQTIYKNKRGLEGFIFKNLKPNSLLKEYEILENQIEKKFNSDIAQLNLEIESLDPSSIFNDSNLRDFLKKDYKYHIDKIHTLDLQAFRDIDLEFVEFLRDIEPSWIQITSMPEWKNRSFTSKIEILKDDAEYERQKLLDSLNSFRGLLKQFEIQKKGKNEIFSTITKLYESKENFIKTYTTLRNALVS